MWITPSLLPLFISAPFSSSSTSPHLLPPHNSILFSPFFSSVKSTCIHLFSFLPHSFPTLFLPPTLSSRCLFFSPPPLLSAPLSLHPRRLSIHQYFSSRQIASLLYCCAELTVCLSPPWALNTLNQRLKEIDTLPVR